LDILFQVDFPGFALAEKFEVLTLLLNGVAPYVIRAFTGIHGRFQSTPLAAEKTGGTGQKILENHHQYLMR